MTIDMVSHFRRLLTVSSISTLFLGAAGLADRLLANAFVEAFFLWVDFLAFPAIFLFFKWFLLFLKSSLFSVKNLKYDE